MCGTFLRENREIPLMPAVDGTAGRSGKAIGRNPEMHVGGKSDGSVLPTKQPNKAEGPAAEVAEGRDPIKGNTDEQNASRTQSRVDAHSALERVRKAAKADKRKRFTALLHHVGLPPIFRTSTKAVIGPPAALTQIDLEPDIQCSSVTGLDCKMFRHIERRRLVPHHA
jgi:hypothetical protein